MKELALSLPGGYSISPPGGIPQNGMTSGENLLQAALTITFTIAIALFIAFIVYSGIQWAISGGDKQKLQQARSRITFSIIGLIVVLAAFFIVRIVFTVLGGSGTPGLFFPNTP